MPNKYISKITIPEQKSNSHELKVEIGVDERKMNTLADRMRRYQEAHPEMSGNAIYQYFEQDIYNLINKIVVDRIGRTFDPLVEEPPMAIIDDTTNRVLQRIARDNPIPEPQVPEDYVELICCNNGLYRYENGWIGHRPARVLNTYNLTFMVGERYIFPREDVRFEGRMGG